ncbi:MAG: family 78 glycoside hydrolase catalytic domain [Mangrovibacterium sp.]
MLDQQGNLYTENLRAARAEDSYILKGEGPGIFEPHFTFHGFRYVHVAGYEEEPGLDDLEGCVIHSDLPQTGYFECSDELINRLQQNIDWGLRGNFLDVPTDCPQRDERLGWTGDAQIFALTACFNRETVCFYSKWMKDFIADQRTDGSVPWVIPNVVTDGGGTGWSDGFGATGWADAAVIVPWTVYQIYGNKRILEDQYDSMKGWVEQMIRESGEARIFNKGFHFGDWLSFSEYYSYQYNAPDYGYAGAHTDKDLIATAYFYHTTGLMQKIAAILGKAGDAERYASILPEIRSAFRKEFMTPTGRLTSNTQTAYVLALSFGLVPDDLVPVAAKRLAGDVGYFGHLTTGFLGTPLICQALTDHGYPEIAFSLLFNKRYPSWLYPVTMGATTIWERWGRHKARRDFPDCRDELVQSLCLRRCW